MLAEDSDPTNLPCTYAVLEKKGAESWKAKHERKHSWKNNNLHTMICPASGFSIFLQE